MRAFGLSVTMLLAARAVGPAFKPPGERPALFQALGDGW
jgi:hypothetical protein